MTDVSEPMDRRDPAIAGRMARSNPQADAHRDLRSPPRRGPTHAPARIRIIAVMNNTRTSMFFATTVTAGLTLGGCAYSQYAAPSERGAAYALNGVRVDHVLVTLTTPQYELLDAFLTKELAASWTAPAGQRKGFIRTSQSTSYVELWDAGGFYSYGDQIAVSSGDPDRDRAIAAAYYDRPGIDWSSFGAPGLYTVGEQNHVGDPLGGTFFVSYGDSERLPEPASPVATLKRIVTALPRFRMNEVETYQAFGFTADSIVGGIEFRDESDIAVRIMQRENTDFMSWGHLALQFKLADPAPQRRIVTIDAMGQMQAVFDGDNLWLLLRTNVFNPFAESDDVR